MLFVEFRVSIWKVAEGRERKEKRLRERKKRVDVRGSRTICLAELYKMLKILYMVLLVVLQKSAKDD